MRRSLNAALFAVFTSLTQLACASSALPQFKPSRSDLDLNAIGHRKISGNINFFSWEKELALGKQLAQEVERSSKMFDDPFTCEYLSRLAQNIEKNSDAKLLRINVRVIDSNEINAFTLPGGYQYVNRGLILATNSEAELAGVLAYDIAHTALRTGTSQATKGELMQLSSIPAMVSMPYTWASYDMYQGLNLVIPLTFLKFSREAVSAADFYAVQYLYKAGYNAEAYPQFLERALQQPPNSQNIPKTFSTHPPLAQSHYANSTG